MLITHAGARAVWETPRMKPDEVLRAVAATGGVIGMSAAPHTTLSHEHPRHTIDSVMDHFRYCVDLVGIEHVAFGPDTLYGDHVALHRVFAHLLSLAAMRGPEFEPVGYVDGLENPTENFANICDWLVRHDFSDDDIRAVLGGNIYRAAAGRVDRVSPRLAGACWPVRLAVLADAARRNSIGTAGQTGPMYSAVAQRRVDVLSLASFVALGLPDGMLGTAWPAMRASLHAPVSYLGLILLASTVGSITITTFIGRILHRTGVARPLAAGLACAAVAAAGFALAPRSGS